MACLAAATLAFFLQSDAGPLPLPPLDCWKANSASSSSSRLAKERKKEGRMQITQQQLCNILIALCIKRVLLLQCLSHKNNKRICKQDTTIVMRQIVSAMLNGSTCYTMCEF